MVARCHEPPLYLLRLAWILTRVYRVLSKPTIRPALVMTSHQPQ